MAASHVFGTGLAEKKIKEIIKEIPDILKIPNKKELRERVMKVDGISDILADKFVDNLDTFNIFYNQLKKRYNLKYLEDNIDKKKEQNKEQTFKEQKIVFTGFRDVVLQDLIESQGGKVSTSVSSKTTLVIHADNEINSTKLKDAEKLNINIISKSKFLEKYNIKA
jgi:NAD-dependent DNA ligase